MSHYWVSQQSFVTIIMNSESQNNSEPQVRRRRRSKRRQQFGGGRRFNSRPSHKKKVNPFTNLCASLQKPKMHCNRCGQNYYGSWCQDIRCTKCGRCAEPIHFWQGALCFVLPPLAIVGYVLQRKISPRNALQLIIFGVAGLIGELLFRFALTQSAIR